MGDYCAICAQSFSQATCILKCGHKFCSECIISNVALNTGTEEGTSRNLCPLCRDPICAEVLPSAKYTIRMKDLQNEASKLKTILDKKDKQLSNIFIRNKTLITKNHSLISKIDGLNEDYISEKFRAQVRRDTIIRSRTNILGIKNYINKNYEHCHQVVEIMKQLDNLLSPGDSREPPSLKTEYDDTPEFMALIPQDIETMSELSIQNLKKWTHYIGLDDSTCIEKSDLVSLLINSEYHARSRTANYKNKIEISIGDHIYTYITQRYSDSAEAIRNVLCNKYVNGSEHLVLKQGCEPYLPGRIISEVLSFYALVKKYPGENVTMQRARLTRVLELRNSLIPIGPGNVEKDLWTSEKMHKFFSDYIQLGNRP